MFTNEAAREARARRMARKFDLELVKSRRDLDRGRYAIRDPFQNIGMFGFGPNGFEASLEDVEEWLAAE
jgi:hypothetical protein